MTRVLLIGDTFGRPGRNAVFSLLPRIISEDKVDFVILNGENAAAGKGITPDICMQFFDIGVDVITTGNHVRDQKIIDTMLESDPRLLRPFNYPASMPGSGLVVRTARNGKHVAVINAIGKVHMGEYESPFVRIKKLVEELRTQTSLVILDMHAEATSEKRAMGWHLDGLASAVLGTHSHVQTADEEILPKGTAYLTDVGMTGPYESVIGLRIDLAMERFLDGNRKNFEVAKGDVRLCGAMVDLHDTTGSALAIQRVRHNVPTSFSS